VRSWLGVGLLLAALAGGCGGGASRPDGGTGDAGIEAAPANQLAATIGGALASYAGSATLARTFANDGWMLAVVGSRGTAPGLDTLTLLIVRRDGMQIEAGGFTCGTTEPDVTLTTRGAAAIACTATVDVLDTTADRARGTFAGMLDASTPIADGVFDVPLAVTAP